MRVSMRMMAPWSAGAVALGLSGMCDDARAEALDGVDWSVSYTGDVLSAWGDGKHGRARALDSLHATADFDLGALINLTGAAAHIDVNSTSGFAPNDDVGAVQGLSNIEVERARTRLYEFWIEQAGFGGRASLRFGFQEINSEFYATDSSGLLINPSFGLPAEFASTGTNGPSTFPSTALALRGRWAPSDAWDVRVAVFNALAASVGDPGGADTSFDGGVLTIAEATWSGWGALSLGVWDYSDKQPDIYETDAFGDPLMRGAQGFYVMAEHSLWGAEDEARRTTGFLRLGFADGDTSPVDTGWQAGVLIEEAFSGRPDSAISIGLTGAHMSDGARAALSDAGADPADSEHILELAYSDQLTPWLRVQPDVQWIVNPGAESGRDSMVAAGVRLSFDFASQTD